MNLLRDEIVYETWNLDGRIFFLGECYYGQQKKLFQSDAPVTKMGVSFRNKHS